MGEEGGGKTTGIWNVVRMREMLQKWQSLALGSRADAAARPGGISPATDKRLKRIAAAAAAASDSDDDNCQSPDPPLDDVPKGYVAVYVGPQEEHHRRFVIPTSYLGQPVFKELLKKTEEEFGFDHQGAITFPCEIETFKYILQCMQRYKKRPIHDGNHPIDVEQ